MNDQYVRFCLVRHYNFVKLVMLYLALLITTQYTRKELLCGACGPRWRALGSMALEAAQRPYHRLSRKKEDYIYAATYYKLYNN